MPSPEFQELIHQVDGLYDATREGSVTWAPVNPTTYVWEKLPGMGGPGAKITLQKAENVVNQYSSGGVRSARMSYFILQVHETQFAGQSVLRLTISGLNQPEVNEKLEKLFQLIGSGISERGLKFFKSIIPQR